jgi:hypothetical protein
MSWALSQIYHLASESNSQNRGNYDGQNKQTKIKADLG